MENIKRTIMYRLLNTYLREVDCAVRPDALPEHPAGLSGELGKAGISFRLDLPETGRIILAHLVKPSLSGHHGFSGPISRLEPGRARPIRMEEPMELAQLLLAELGAREKDPFLGGLRGADLLKDMEISVKSILSFAPRFRPEAGRRVQVESMESMESAKSVESMEPAARLHVEAEQSILFGHPFHPSPKSADPFDAFDLAAYRPEMGASFRLHYFALDPRICVQDFLPEAGEIIPAEARGDVLGRLPAGKEAWPLLPSHPWQARYLLETSEARRLMEEGRLLHLGPSGSRVFPTSSVRTVYSPENDGYFKLPMDVRITNFVRTNPREHLERSLSASRVLGILMPGFSSGPLVILPELGYRGIAAEAWAGSGAEDRSAGFGVLFRKGFGATGTSAPLVVAALLEPGEEGHPLLDSMLWRASRARGQALAADFHCAWFKAYLESAMRPLLELFRGHGLSLEAHVQNSLMSFQEGWPDKMFVRDLEGTTLSRERADASALQASAGPGWESLLCEDAIAWERLQYYLFVNHLGHLAACLASRGQVEEWQLWETAREMLETMKDGLPGSPAAMDGIDRSHPFPMERIDYIEDLLSKPTLPAKANLISRFRGRSEKPIYLPVPNPLNEAVLCP